MNAPKEITTPPEGYEWTGEIRTPQWATEPYGEWHHFTGQWTVAQGQGHERSDSRYPILRKIKSPTVMVELQRETADWFLQTTGTQIDPVVATRDAIRAALEAGRDAACIRCGEEAGSPESPYHGECVTCWTDNPLREASQ